MSEWRGNVDFFFLNYHFIQFHLEIYVNAVNGRRLVRGSYQKMGPEIGELVLFAEMKPGKLKMMIFPPWIS